MTTGTDSTLAELLANGFAGICVNASIRRAPALQTQHSVDMLRLCVELLGDSLAVGAVHFHSGRNQTRPGVIDTHTVIVVDHRNATAPRILAHLGQLLDVFHAAELLHKEPEWLRNGHALHVGRERDTDDAPMRHQRPNSELFWSRLFQY